MIRIMVVVVVHCCSGGWCVVVVVPFVMVHGIGVVVVVVVHLACGTYGVGGIDGGSHVAARLSFSQHQF